MSSQKTAISKRPNNSKKLRRKSSKLSPFIVSKAAKPSHCPVLNPVVARTNPQNSPQAKKDKFHRRTVSDTTNLAPLQGKVHKKAPKVYRNQIFRDVYDEFGNHDRIIDTVQSIEIYEEVNKGSLVTFNNKSDLTTEKFIQPDESYRSIEITSKAMKDELLEKLQEVHKVQNNFYEDFMKQITIERHCYKKNMMFVFSNLN